MQIHTNLLSEQLSNTADTVDSAVVYNSLLNLCLNNWNSWSFSIFLLSQPRPPASGENHFILLTFIFSLSYKIMHTNLNLSILLRQPMFTKWKFLVITSSNRKTRIPLYIRTHKYLSVWRETSLNMSKQEFKTCVPSICLYLIHSL